MNRQTFLMLLVSTVAIVASGVVHGWFTQRWTDTDPAVQQAVERLKLIPDSVGEWELKEEFKIPERQLEMGEIDGYISRSYVHRTTGETVGVIIVCGRHGPISVHTPDVCFRGQGLQQTREQEQETIATAASADVGECWQSDFVKPDAAITAGLRAWWTWSADGEWSAPQYPRWVFRNKPVLYKMYVTRALGGGSEDQEESDADDPARRFLGEWLPAVNQALFPAAASDPPADKPTDPAAT